MKTTILGKTNGKTVNPLIQLQQTTSVFLVAFGLGGLDRQPIRALKKCLLPVLVLVCALGGRIRANTTIYDGTYTGTFSGTVVCVGPGGTVTGPVPLEPDGFRLLNGVVSPGTGGVDAHGNFNWIRSGGGTDVTWIGAIGLNGHASGTWSLEGIPNCTEGGTWSAQREACSRPTVTTDAATFLTNSGATLRGMVSPNGLTATAHFQYGLTASYGSVTADQIFGGTTSQSFSAMVYGLNPSTTYHFRTVAINSCGITYGSDTTFTTLSPTGPPVATTNPATFIAGFSAMLNGSLDPHGLATTVHFQYGTTTNYGLTTAPQSHTGNAYVNVGANISSLSASTIYHFRIVASNSAGTRLGSDRTFTTLTLTGAPVVTTNPATNVTSSSVTLNSSLNPHGLTTTVYFQYGTTTSYGHATASQAKAGSAYQGASASVSGLSANTTYHFRVVATNSAGTRYGADRTFTTP